jgi:prepilin-type N-terminal cleavage/methylation domain-containing protein
MKLPTSNAQRSTLNVQSTRFERWKLNVERWTFRPSFIPHSAFRTPHSPRAFTLIELILVMALITIVVSVSLPSLKGFFRGRDLDSEARRFLSLTRYGASRAVAEGIPVELYVDTQQRLYGLRAQAGFLDRDTKRVEYKLPEEISFEVTAAPQKKVSGEDNLDDPDEQFLNNLDDTSDSGNPIKIIRFNSDGFIGEKSPAAVLLRQRSTDETASAEGDAIAIAQSATRLNYEIRTLQRP